MRRAKAEPPPTRTGTIGSGAGRRQRAPETRRGSSSGERYRSGASSVWPRLSISASTDASTVPGPNAAASTAPPSAPFVYPHLPPGGPGRGWGQPWRRTVRPGAWPSRRAGAGRRGGARRGRPRGSPSPAAPDHAGVERPLYRDLVAGGGAPCVEDEPTGLVPSRAPRPPGPRSPDARGSAPHRRHHAVVRVHHAPLPARTVVAVGGEDVIAPCPQARPYAAPRGLPRRRQEPRAREEEPGADASPIASTERRFDTSGGPIM